MSGPIQGSFTPQQIQDLQAVWQDLFHANPKSIQSDINKLQQMFDALPPNSREKQSLGDVLTSLKEALASPNPQENVQEAEEMIADMISPQLPKILPQQTIQDLTAIYGELNKPLNPDQLQKILSRLDGIISQTQTLPNSPQKSMVLQNLGLARDGIDGLMQKPPTNQWSQTGRSALYWVLNRG